MDNYDEEFQERLAVLDLGKAKKELGIIWQVIDETQRNKVKYAIREGRIFGMAEVLTTHKGKQVGCLMAHALSDTYMQLTWLRDVIQGNIFVEIGFTTVNPIQSSSLPEIERLVLEVSPGETIENSEALRIVAGWIGEIESEAE